MTNQGALLLRFPAQDQQDSIRRAALRILQHHAGQDRAIHRARLAQEIRSELGLHHLTATTLERRLREALGELLDDGQRIVSDQHGIYLPLTADEIQAGDRALAGNAFGALRRLSKYRRVALPDLLKHLGQTAMELGDEG